jgi:hypothetical protein
MDKPLKLLTMSSQTVSIISSIASLYVLFNGTMISIPVKSQSLITLFGGSINIPLIIIFGAITIYYINKSINERK